MHARRRHLNSNSQKILRPTKNCWLMSLLRTAGVTALILQSVPPMKMTQSIKRLLLITGLLFSIESRADDTPFLSDNPTLLPAMAISEKTTRRKIYDVKVENLWETKQKSKTISYVEVLTAAYDTTRFDLIKCLLAKKAYRETIAKDRPFFCNYAAANREVKINWVPPRLDNFMTSRVKVGEGTTAQGVAFNYATLEITLASDAPLPALLAASGTALSGFPSKKSAEEIKSLIAKKAEKVVAQHVEFELKLQDLNRYYATFTGTPIMNPLEAVNALVMFGHVPGQKIVTSILQRYGVAATEAQIDAALKSGKVKRDGRTETFEHAYRLVDGVSAFGIAIDSDDLSDGMTAGDPDNLRRYQVEDGLNQKSHADYDSMLERIIIEAPGHI